MAKSQKTVKTEKRKAPPTAWKKGQSGNPGGRPKNQQSISYWLKEFLQLSPKQLAEQFRQYAKQLEEVKGDMPIAAQLAIRTLMGQMNEPGPGLMALIFERTEGKIADKVEVYDWRKDAADAGIDPDALAAHLFAKVTPDHE